jgi:putative ABC transport system substrate-binding protein
MRRRTFIAALGGAAAWPVLGRAQASLKRPLIAWLSGGERSASSGFVDAFLQGMLDLGYIQGRDFDIVYRYADGYAERLPALAEELVRLRPNVILAVATGQAVAAKHATATIPIVTPALADAVHLGLVASEARPRRNVTGIASYVPGLPAKQIELAREIIPGARRIGVLNDSNDPKPVADQFAIILGRWSPQWMELDAAGRALGIDVVATEVRTPDDLASAFETLARQWPDVVIVLQTSMLLSERRKIADLAAAMRLPTIYGYREYVVDGGLISYGVDLRDCFRRSAVYVRKILDGTGPGDLPVEFPTKLELVVNLKTAKVLGLEIPPTLLARADEVIE